MENNDEREDGQTYVNERILAALEKINERLDVMEEQDRGLSSRLSILEGEKILDQVDGSVEM